MKAFSTLWQALGSSGSDDAAVSALVDYLRKAPTADAAWALHLLRGGKPAPCVSLKTLRAWVCDWVEVPPWLYDTSHAAVGDHAETLAHLLPIAQQPVSLPLSVWIDHTLSSLRNLAPDQQASPIRAACDRLASEERLLAVKLMTGSFRMPLKTAVIARALAQVHGLSVGLVTQRLHAADSASGRDRRQPEAADLVQRLAALTRPADPATDPDRAALPFGPARAWPGEAPGEPSGWQLEWQVDGQRVQVVRRGGRSGVWSRDEQLLNGQVPGLVALADRLPENTVIDGLLPTPADSADPPGRGIRRGAQPNAATADAAAPTATAALVAFDVLCHAGEDLRGRPLSERRARLAALAATVGFPITEAWPVSDGTEVFERRQRARACGARGVVLKRLDAPYPREDRPEDSAWWAWPAEPLTADLVLLYAEGVGVVSGSAAGLKASFSLAAWNRPPVDAAEIDAVLDEIRQRRPPAPQRLHLVPVARLSARDCGTGLPVLLDAVRTATVGRFGPVLSLLPQQVLRVGFEGVRRSPRHKSGLILLAPQLIGIGSADDLMAVSSLSTLKATLG